jgi:phosphoglucosamine mutase
MLAHSERRLFGTDGIRGIANQHPMTCEVALALGRAVAYQARHGTHRHKIIVGKDTRLSGYMLEMAFASGVCSMGVDVILTGPIPTPAVAFLTRDMRADAGVMISASHNPYHDNGIKIFARNGFKLPDAQESELERYMEDEKVGKVRPTRTAVGKASRIEDAAGRYVVSLKSTIPNHITLEGLKIVVDCAHGAAYKCAPTLLRELGAEVITTGAKPDGRNINHHCGALHPKHLQKTVLKHQADAGIALDGDADRLIVVDNEGHVVDGDCLLALGALDLQQKGLLTHNTVVATTMSNFALDRILGERGIQVVRTPVGDRYVVQEMRSHGYVFGGEQSGHLVYLQHGTTGDGLLAALMLLSHKADSNLPLSTLRNLWKPYPQSLVNIAVREKRPLTALPRTQKTIREIETALGSDGRVMVRYSGTELKARVLVEGPHAEQVAAWAQRIASTLSDELG